MLGSTVNRFLLQDFGAFDYIGSYETSLSQINADLLDPRGGHGQGAIFLEEFLRMLGQQGLIGECGKARVQREVRLGPGSTIDIVVEIGSFVIGIENKPWAVEQPKQLCSWMAGGRSEDRKRDHLTLRA